MFFGVAKSSPIHHQPAGNLSAGGCRSDRVLVKFCPKSNISQRISGPIWYSKFSKRFPGIPIPSQSFVKSKFCCRSSQKKRSSWSRFHWLLPKARCPEGSSWLGDKNTQLASLARHFGVASTDFRWHMETRELGICVGPIISDLKTGLVGDLNLRNQDTSPLWRAWGVWRLFVFNCLLGMFFFMCSGCIILLQKEVQYCMSLCHEVTKYSSGWWRVVLGSLFVW